MFAIEQRYLSLEERIEAACNAQDEHISEALRKFGTVLICGFVERSVEVVILERLRSRAHPRILKFVKSHFQRGTNFNCNAIENLLDRFESNWKQAFATFVGEHEKEAEGLRSTYSVRNSVAHGGNANVSARALRDWCTDSKTIVDGMIEATSH